MAITADRGPTAPQRRVFVQVLAALGLGLFVGLFFGESVAPLGMVSDGFIRLLQVTVLPYVLGSLLAGLGTRAPADAKRLAIRGGAILLLFWLAGLSLMAVTSLAYPPDSRAATFFSTEASPTSEIDWLALYIPSNLFSSLANNIMPAVVLFGLLAGTALSGMGDERKRGLLDAIQGFNEAMSRVARMMVRIMPIGLFAIAATTAGLMRPDQLLRLQLWFIVYIGSACIVALWILPALVALLTPIPYREFITALRAALLTAFAAGDLFIVLPLISEECKTLLKKHGVSPADADATIGVVVPLLFNFPHTGKVLSLGFLPFAAWFSGSPLNVEQWGRLAGSGILTMFGSLNAAVPFLLDLLRLPADLFGLFLMSSVLNGRFGALVATTHTAALAVVIAFALTRRPRLTVTSVVRFAVGSLVLVALFVGGTRAVFAFLVPPAAEGLAALAGFHLRQPLATLVDSGASDPTEGRPVPGRRFSEITERAVLRVGYFPDAVPYAFLNAQGELIGYDVEMAHALARDLGVAIEFVETTREQAHATLVDGACDIIMSGFVVSVGRARLMALSRPYQEERLGFLVPDHQRRRYVDLSTLEYEQLRVGLPAVDDIAPLIRQRLAAAQFVRFLSIEALVAALPDVIDAAVLPMDRAYYLSRIHPSLTAVLPDQNTSAIMLSYALPAGESELLRIVDAWIDVKRAQGAFESANAYWVRGAGLYPQQPRWSIARNVFGWLR